MTTSLGYYKGVDIASASSITPGPNGTYHDVIGTTTITSMTSRRAGSVVALRIITGGLTFTHLTGTLNMRGKLDFTAQSGDIVGLIAEGAGEWSEIWRSSSDDGLDQAFEVLLIAVAPPDVVDATSTGTGTNGVTSIILTAVAPPAPTVATAVT